jgi:hypothetical protein
MSNTRCALLLGLTVVMSAAGCQGKASVSGAVLVDGKKLVNGYITFYPATDRNESTGARAETRGTEITDGSYTIENLSPGKRKVVISVPAKLEVQKAADGSDAGVKAVPPAAPISPSAKGNSCVVEIGAGSQTLDFEVKLK